MGKGIIILVILLVLVAGSFFLIKNVGENISGNTIDSQEVENLNEATLAIEGMYCQACSYAVKAQMEELYGVVSVDINYKDASGVVLYDVDKVDAESIAAASTAYPASVVSDNPK